MAGRNATVVVVRRSGRAPVEGDLNFRVRGSSGPHRRRSRSRLYFIPVRPVPLSSSASRAPLPRSSTSPHRFHPAKGSGPCHPQCGYHAWTYYLDDTSAPRRGRSTAGFDRRSSRSAARDTPGAPVFVHRRGAPPPRTLLYCRARRRGRCRRRPSNSAADRSYSVGPLEGRLRERPRLQHVRSAQPASRPDRRRAGRLPARAGETSSSSWPLRENASVLLPEREV